MRIMVLQQWVPSSYIYNLKKLDMTNDSQNKLTDDKR